MKPFLVIIFISLHGIIMAQHIQPGTKGNDTLYNILLKNHLLGAYITDNKQQMFIKGTTINDTLYIYINKKPKKISLSELNNHLQSINDSLIQSGFLFNRLQPDSIKIRKKDLHIFYHILKNNKSKIDSLIIIPPHNFPKNIRKILNKMVDGKTINSQNTKTISNFVNNETGFKLKSLPAINFYQGQNILVLKLQNMPNNQIDGMIGFNYNSKKSKLQLEGNLKTKFFNLFKAGEQIFLEWQRKDNNQNIQLNTQFPFIKASNFEISNFLSSKRKDTTGFALTNLSRLTYRTKKQSFGINFTYQFTAKEKHDYSDRFGGIYYRKDFDNKPNNWSVSFQTHLDINFDKPDKKIFYTRLRSTEKLQKHIVLTHNFQIYNTNQENITPPANLLNDLFRKATLPEDNFSSTISFKNDIIYRLNHTNFYIIGDYISRNNLNNSTTRYVNTGVGISFLKKNQSLKIEIIKALFNSYSPDFQHVYVNIKQSLRF